MIFFRLFYEFFKVGLFSVGGGMATIPFLQDISERLHWFSTSELSDMIAVSESTPGPIGVNMATFAGYKTAFSIFHNQFTGVLGGIVATLGLIAPAVIVIMLVLKALKKFSDNKYVNGAMYGLRAVSMALISYAGLGVMKITLLNLDAFSKSGNIADLFVFKTLILAVIIFVLQKIFKKIHPIVFIVAAAVVGIVFNFA